MKYNHFYKVKNVFSFFPVFFSCLQRNKDQLNYIMSIITLYHLESIKHVALNYFNLSNPWSALSFSQTDHYIWLKRRQTRLTN